MALSSEAGLKASAGTTRAAAVDLLGAVTCRLCAACREAELERPWLEETLAAMGARLAGLCALIAMCWCLY